MELVNPESYLADLCSLRFLLQGHFLFLFFFKFFWIFSVFAHVQLNVSRSNDWACILWYISAYHYVYINHPSRVQSLMNIAVVAWDPRLQLLIHVFQIQLDVFLTILFHALSSPFQECLMYQQISSNIQSLISPSDFLENVHINFIGKNYFFMCN